MTETHEKQIADVTRGWAGASGVRNELKRLPQRLATHERLINVDRAECTGRTGLLAVTDARLLFLRERMFKSEVDEYPFEDVRALHLEPQFLVGPKLVLDLDSGPVEFKKVDRTRAPRIVDYVRSRLGGDEVEVPVAAPADVEELKRSLGMVNRAVLWLAYRRLPDVLQGGESLGPASFASYNGTSGLLLATDRRLVFVPNGADKPLGKWRYQEIRDVELPDPKTIAVLAGGRRETLSNVDDDRAEPIVGHVRPRLERAKSRAEQVDEALSTGSGAAPAAKPEPSPPPQQRPEAKRPAPPRERVDLNTATADELHERLGLDRSTAQNAVTIRSGRGRFKSVDEFADALALPPHLLQAVRSGATADSSTVREPPHTPGDLEVH